MRSPRGTALIRPIRFLLLLVTLVVVGALALLSGAALLSPAVTRSLAIIVLFATVIFVAAVGGIGHGLLSAAIALAYYATTVSLPGQLFLYDEDSLLRLMVVGVVLIGTALLVGYMRRRINTLLATERRLRAEAEQARVAAEEAARMLQRLQAVTDTALAHLSLDTLLDELLERVCEILEIDTATILLLDPETDTLVPHAARGLEEEVEQQVRIPMGQGFSGRVAAERRPVIIAHLEPAHLFNQLLLERGICALLGVPLMVEGRVIGVLHVGSFQPRDFSQEDIQLLELVADRVAVSIEHAHLYGAEREARAQAEEAVSARDAFLSIASHELKTPLTALLASTELLVRRAARNGATEAPTTRAIQIIHTQSRRLEKLVAMLLNISRLQTGHLTLEREPVDLCRLVRQVAEEIEPLLTRHRIELICPDHPLVVHADDLRLQQVVYNLLDNGVKYSPDGGVVTVRVERDGPEAIIAVSDRGVGIPAAGLEKLFTRFYRANNVDYKRFPGMGLGLFVVREIIELHGGTVRVESVEGEGTTFTLRLPIDGSGP